MPYKADIMKKEAKKEVTPKLVDFETDLLNKLKEEALTGPENETYRGHVNPLINAIVREHFKRKAKKK